MKVVVSALVDDLGERITGQEVMDCLNKHLGVKVESVSISELGKNG